MGCNIYHIVAITFTTISLLMLLVTVGTPAMMTGCMGMGSAMKSIGKTLGSMDMGSQDATNALGDVFNGVGNPLGDQKVCLGQGLMRAEVSFGSISSASFKIDPRAMQTYIYVAAGTLCIGSILCLSAMIVLIVSTCGENGSYEAKTRSGARTRTAMILLGITVGFCLVGMTAYSIGSAAVKKNPLAFMGAFSSAIGSMDSNGLDANNPFSRGKRDVVSDVAGDVLSMFVGMTISYGYSFILGWVTTVMLVLSLVLTGLARYKLIQQPYSGSATIKF